MADTGANEVVRDAGSKRAAADESDPAREQLGLTFATEERKQGLALVALGFENVAHARELSRIAPSVGFRTELTNASSGPE